MANITPVSAPGRYAAVGVTLSFQAWSGSEDQWLAKGNDLLIARNTNLSDAQTVTVTSVADQYGRTRDVTTYSIAAGEIGVFGPFPLHGWRAATGYILVEASDIAVEFAVVRIPE